MLRVFVQWTRAEEEAAEKVKRRIGEEKQNSVTHTDSPRVWMRRLISMASTQKTFLRGEEELKTTLKVKSRSARANENENIRHREAFWDY